MILTALAVVTDLDGVLVDSKLAVESAWRAWSAERGKDAATVLAVAHGRRTVDVLRLVAPELDAEAEVARILAREAADGARVRPVAGAAEFVRSLPPGCWAIATSGEERIARARLRSVRIEAPRTLVTAECVERGKPHPDVYLRAAAALGIPPEDCIAFEDAPAGMESARAAGMTPVGVLTSFAARELGAAAAFVADFTHVRLRSPHEIPLRIEIPTG